MFRPPPPHHPHGGPPRNNNLYSQQSPGMTGGAGFGPSAFPMHGRGRGSFHPPFQGGPSYHMFPPSGPPPVVRPPPPPGSPPAETPPPPPPPPSSDGSFRSAPKSAPPPPPPMPEDAEMLKNIEILSSFVVKNGPQFENMARAKQAGDPKFAFLFGGERGSDAAFGYDFYNWKKEHLMWVEERSKGSPVDQQRPSEPNLQGKNGGPVVPGTSPEASDSPTGSDMDMEDDFAFPDPADDKNSDLDRTAAVTSTAVGRKSGQSPTSTERRVGVSSAVPELKPDISSSSLETKPALPSSASERRAGHESVQSKVGSQVDRDFTQQSGNRSAAETQGNPYGGNTPRATDTSRVQRETTSQNAPRRRDTRRRTGFDRPCMEDVSPQGSPVKNQQQIESLPTLDTYLKGTSGNGYREGLTKLSRWGPEPASEGISSGISASDMILEGSKGSKRLDTSTRKKGEISFSKDELKSPDVAAKPLRSHADANLKDNEKLKPKPGSDQRVDEFGRLLRQGGSDSDLDDDRYIGRKKKRRRTVSRSRSHSPGDRRSKYLSPERSPRGWGRRSRSWSRSPRRNKSRSLTPPRDGRRGGEGRGARGPAEKGGRRGGSRGGVGPTPTCYDFLKGRCSRGSSCRYSHDDSHGGNVDQGGKWSDGRGRDREQGQAGRVGEEGERNWGGRSGEDAKYWRPFESNERGMEEPRQSKLIAESKKQEYGTSVDEPGEHDKAGSDASKLADDVGRTGNYQQVVSSSQIVTKAFANSSTAPPISQSQSSISPGPISQAGQQGSALPTKIPLSQQSSALPNSTSEPHKLGDLISPESQQSPVMVSPTPHSQQVQFSPGLTHLQQNPLSTTLQSQKPGQHQPLPAVSQINSFASNPMHQQFTTAARILLPGSSPPLQVLPRPFAAVPLRRPQTSFGGSQQPNFAQFSNNNEQSSVQFRPPVGGGQTQILRSPMVPTLQQRRPGLPWMPGGIGPPTSYPLGPPPSLPQPPQSLQHPIQPLHQPSQPLPPQVSTAAAGVYSYALPSSFTMPLFSTPSSNHVPAQPRPSIQDQYDPLSDSLEPAPPGSVNKNGVVSSNQGSSQENSGKPEEAEQWRHIPRGVTAPLMTNAGEVVLENVSPGLPGHVEAVVRGSGVMEKVSPTPQSEIFMENVSPTDVGNATNTKASMKLEGPQLRAPMENVSPPEEIPKESAGEGGKESGPETKEEKKKDKEGRVLNLIRKAVADHVKEALKPTWKGGQITKEAFKTIAKKAVDKVMGALEAKGQIPKTREKVDSFMTTSKPKIAKLVQGYVEKYSK